MPALDLRYFSFISINSSHDFRWENRTVSLRSWCSSFDTALLVVLSPFRVFVVVRFPRETRKCPRALTSRTCRPHFAMNFKPKDRQLNILQFWKKWYPRIQLIELFQIRAVHLNFEKVTSRRADTKLYVLLHCDLERAPVARCQTASVHPCTAKGMLMFMSLLFAPPQQVWAEHDARHMPVGGRFQYS